MGSESSTCFLCGKLHESLSDVLVADGDSHRWKACRARVDLMHCGMGAVMRLYLCTAYLPDKFDFLWVIDF